MAIVKEFNKDKKITTEDLERALFYHESKMWNYLCREVGIPNSKERVDYLRYSKVNKSWYFYELKITLADFNSKCAHSFYGNFNYYVVPYYLVEQIKNKVPHGVGIISVENNCNCHAVKKAKKQDLQLKHDDLMFNFMQALDRENKHYNYHGKYKNYDERKSLKSIISNYEKQNRDFEKEVECEVEKRTFYLTRRNNYLQKKLDNSDEIIIDLELKLENQKVIKK